MIPTARVQRGPSEAARCASTGIVPATPPRFQHPARASRVLTVQQQPGHGHGFPQVRDNV